MSRLNHNKRHPLLQIVMSKKSNWQKLTNTGKNNFYWTFLLPGSFSRLWVTKVLNSRRWLSQKSDSLFTSQQIKGKSYNTITVLPKWKKKYNGQCGAVQDFPWRILIFADFSMWFWLHMRKIIQMFRPILFSDFRLAP